jgi:hypothetical protein
MRFCALSGVLAVAATAIAVLMMHYAYRDPLICIATGVVGAALLAIALQCVRRRAASEEGAPMARREMIRALCDEDEDSQDDELGHGARLA